MLQSVGAQSSFLFGILQASAGEKPDQKVSSYGNVFDRIVAYLLAPVETDSCRPYQRGLKKFSFSRPDRHVFGAWENRGSFDE
jgi:hypothetical protein